MIALKAILVTTSLAFKEATFVKNSQDGLFSKETDTAASYEKFLPAAIQDINMAHMADSDSKSVSERLSLN